MKLGYRILLVVVLLIGSAVYLAPSALQPLPSWWPSFLPNEPINLERHRTKRPLTWAKSSRRAACQSR